MVSNFKFEFNDILSYYEKNDSESAYDITKYLYLMILLWIR